jgi:hypothetical protein
MLTENINISPDVFTAESILVYSRALESCLEQVAENLESRSNCLIGRTGRVNNPMICVKEIKGLQTVRCASLINL